MENRDSILDIYFRDSEEIDNYELLEREIEENFMPGYKKYVFLEDSIFDNFEFPKKTSDFNYVYCGLRDEQGNIRTKKGQLQKFHNTWKKIEKLGRLKKWKRIISNFIEVDLIDFFIKANIHNCAKPKAPFFTLYKCEFRFLLLIITFASNSMLCR